MSALPVNLLLATDMMGKPLASDTIARLHAVIEDPSQDTWQDAHGIILNGSVGLGLTLWQAVLEIDPSFPRTGPSYTAGHVTGQWDRIPSADLIRQAINYATR